MTVQNRKQTQPNQSGEKMLRIIELFAEKGEPLRVMDVAKELKINASTVLRFILTLENCGYVEQDPQTLRYRLTFKICRIAGKVQASANLSHIAHPFLKELSRIMKESVCLAIVQNMMVTYIDVVEGPDLMVRSMQRIGNVAKMHCTGIGKVFLQDMSPEQIDNLISLHGLTRYTNHTITEKEQLMKELETVRANGYAFDNEECEIGARCVALPVRDYTGNIVAGFSVTGPSGRLTDEWIYAQMDILKKTSEEISARLGYYSSNSRS